MEHKDSILVCIYISYIPKVCIWVTVPLYRIVQHSQVAQWSWIHMPMQEMQVWSLGQEDPLKTKWQPTLVFLPGKPHGQRSLVKYNAWGHKRVRDDLVAKQQHTELCSLCLVVSPLWVTVSSVIWKYVSYPIRMLEKWIWNDVGQCIWNLYIL